MRSSGNGRGLTRFRWSTTPRNKKTIYFIYTSVTIINENLTRRSILFEIRFLYLARDVFRTLSNI